MITFQKTIEKNFKSGLSKIGAAKFFHPKRARQVAGFMREVAAFSIKTNEEHMALARKYAIKNEKGEFMVKDPKTGELIDSPDGSFQVDEERWDEFAEKREALMERELETDFEPFRNPDREFNGLQITPEEMIALEGVWELKEVEEKEKPRIIT